MAKKRKKSRSRKKTKSRSKSDRQNCGWGVLTKEGTYKRGKRYAKYSVVRDAMRRARHKPVPGKPFAGDEIGVYYVVDRKTGRPVEDKVYFSKKDIPKKYKNRKKYAIKLGWI